MSIQHVPIGRSRRHRITGAVLSGMRSAILLALVLAIPVCGLAASLTILHTNDTHGHLLPFSYPSATEGGSIADLPDRTDIGGIARRAALVREVRGEQKDKGIPVWLIDAGDFCDGTPFSTEYHGEADVAAMNAAGYDFGTLGNHEFNNSINELRKLIGLAKYPILCANAIDQGKPLATPSVIREADGVRIGLFGLLTREAATYPAAKEAGIQVGDEVESARRMVAELRPKVDLVVLISHCGETVDEKIAREVPGIDVIVGGHSHSRLPSGELILRSKERKDHDVNGTVIVQAFQWGGELGRLDLDFQKDATGLWHVGQYREQLIPVTSAVTPDDAVASVLDGYWKPIAAKYGEVVGTASADFVSRGGDLAEYNLVADAVRESFGADFDLENMGGVRAPLIKGPVTTADLVTLDPFGNTVVTFQATGRDLKRILEERAPAVSGIRYRLADHKLVEATIGGKPIEDDKLYSGTTNSYFAPRILKGIAYKDSGKARLDVVTDYVRKKGTIDPAYDGRRAVGRE